MIKDLLLVITSAISIYAGIYFAFKAVWAIRDNREERRRRDKEQLIDEVIKRYEANH